MNQIRHQTSSSHGAYPSNQGYRSGYPARPWSPVKKYLVAGAVILALVLGGLFMLAVKIALALTGVLLAAAAVIGGYIYFQRKID
ncbi:MAG TPA: hypothetical protein VFX02_02415 [Gammaproteobacteria bacterium]|nr:hypothetical protein [Gammaproteobacteria bacterium]